MHESFKESLASGGKYAQGFLIMDCSSDPVSNDLYLKSHVAMQHLRTSAKLMMDLGE